MPPKKPKISKAEALRIRINDTMPLVYRAQPGNVLILRPELDEYPYQRQPALYDIPGSGKKLAELPYDAACLVLENQQSWNKVQVADMVGWVHAFDVVKLLITASPELLAHIRQGIEEAKAGKMVSRGSFAEYLDDKH